MSVHQRKRASHTSKCYIMHAIQSIIILGQEIPFLLKQLLLFWLSGADYTSCHTSRLQLSGLLSILIIWQLKVEGNDMQHNHILAQSAYQ